MGITDGVDLGLVDKPPLGVSVKGGMVAVASLSILMLLVGPSLFTNGSTTGSSEPVAVLRPAPLPSLQAKLPPGSTVAISPRPAVLTIAVEPSSEHLGLSPGWNPKSCPTGPPNRTTVDPYKGCPIPGLNNLLYTQHNRWVCLYRDRQRMTLRDRTCNKGSAEKYRYSTMVQVRYDRLAAFREWVSQRRQAGLPSPTFGNTRRGGPGGLLTPENATSPPAVVAAFNAYVRLMLDEAPMDLQLASRVDAKSEPAVCWADIMEKVLPNRCTWSDIPSFYGKPDWWEARQFIDFHPEYYTAARRIVTAAIGKDTPFIGLHLLRCDYQHHCTVIKKKNTPPFVSFWSVPTSVTADGSLPGSCYPTLDQITTVISRVVKDTGIKIVFIATNVPEEFAGITTPIDGVVKQSQHAPWAAFVLPKLMDLSPTPLRDMRFLDSLVLDMVVLSLSSFFVLNRYSSFRGSVFEMATIHGRTSASNVRCW